MRKRITISPKKSLCAITLTLIISGCVGTRAPEPDILQLKWPEPPLQARIIFEKVVGSERDLKSKSSFGESLTKFLTGRDIPYWHLLEPMDIAISNDGKRMYVSDFSQRTVFRFDLATKKVTFIGREKKIFLAPLGITLDDQENLYVVDLGSKNVKVLDRQGNTINIISEGGLEKPTAIAVDSKRKRIYVVDGSNVDSMNHFVKVYTLDGKFIENIGKGKGVREGELYFPTYIALDKDGNIYVSDTLNSRVSIFDPEGNFVMKIGTRGNSFGAFDKPKGVALDSFGNIYVVDSGWSNVQMFNQKGEVLLFFGGRGSYPGLLKNPTGIAIDKNNRIYVGDYLNRRVSIYQLVNTKPEDSFIELPREMREKGFKSVAE